MSILYKAAYSHFASEKKFPTPLIRLWCHCYGLQENIALDDELGRHEHVSREIIVGLVKDVIWISVQKD
jgi:hypothetical protein